MREKYEDFKELLEADRRSHELIAELEDIYYNHKKVDLKAVESRYEELSQAVSAMVAGLSRMAPASYGGLRDYFKKIDSCIRFILTPPDICLTPPFTIPLEKIRPDDHPLVGGKTCKLAYLQNKLDLPVPGGFVVTTNAFNAFVAFNSLRATIDERLALLDITSAESLGRISSELVYLFHSARIPPEVEEAILSSYKALQEKTRRDVLVAMRSSAVSEDTETSFAGQYLTLHNVDEDSLLQGYKQVLAGKYTQRALWYRINFGISDLDTPMAVLVLEMIDAAVSGVMTTVDQQTTDPGTMIIHSLWGLGELLVGGEVSPDTVTINKEDQPKIVQRRQADKFQQMITVPSGGCRTIPVAAEKRTRHSLDDSSALTLARWGLTIEKSFPYPQDIEWCMDSNNRLFVLQARPLKEQVAEKLAADLNEADLGLPILLQAGDRASAGTGAGRVFLLRHEDQLAEIPVGSVLVAPNTLPSYVKAIDRLRAVVTDRGSVAGHFASVAREFGIPALVNTGCATDRLQHGQGVTVDADKKIVYEGIVQSLPDKPLSGHDVQADNPFHRKLKYMIGFISPLTLVDPHDPSFVPAGCRSLHDIIRFVHEKGMAEMFAIGDKREGQVRGAKRLATGLPLMVHVLDVGGGLRAGVNGDQEIPITALQCMPMQAVWQGLTHPGINWSKYDHFDWKTFDDIALAGGVARKGSSAFASYAVISNDYLNMNMRFGYHFTIVDTLCGVSREDNYIMLRFAGGGGNFSGRSLRVEFLATVLNRLGFSVKIKGDLIDAKLLQEEQNTIRKKLDMAGRLLGATRLMDMVLKDSSMVKKYVNDFFQGRYDFSAEGSNHSTLSP